MGNGKGTVDGKDDSGMGVEQDGKGGGILGDGTYRWLDYKGDA